jgi:hypothetical protein
LQLGRILPRLTRIGFRSNRPLNRIYLRESKSNPTQFSIPKLRAEESEVFLTKARALQKKTMLLTQQNIAATIAEKSSCLFLHGVLRLSVLPENGGYPDPESISFDETFG